MRAESKRGDLGVLPRQSSARARTAHVSSHGSERRSSPRTSRRPTAAILRLACKRVTDKAGRATKTTGRARARRVKGQTSRRTAARAAAAAIDPAADEPVSRTIALPRVAHRRPADRPLSRAERQLASMRPPACPPLPSSTSAATAKPSGPRAALRASRPRRCRRFRPNCRFPAGSALLSASLVVRTARHTP